MNIVYFPTSVLYPDTRSNRMIMREIKEPESISFDNEQEASFLKQELEKCGLTVDKKRVKVRSDNVSIFFDSGYIYTLDIYPPEIDIDALSVTQEEAYDVDLDPKEINDSEEDISELIRI